MKGSGVQERVAGRVTCICNPPDPLNLSPNIEGQKMSRDYTLNELMIIEAARHIRDGETVFVGTGMPMVAAMFAQKTHARNMCFVVETGPISPEVLPVPISVSDPKAMHRAAKLGTLREVLGCLLQRGMVDVGFLGGAQIDHYGNLNSTVIGDYLRPKVRFPGSGGANDIASHAKRILVITPHEKRRFPERCSYVTSPGYLDGPEGRKRAGLKSLYPEITVVTDLAVMSIDRSDGTLKAVKLMPGVTLERVQENTEFKVEAVPNVGSVEVPTTEELNILRNDVDPGREYLGKGE
ncbi:MAG TPA: CoA-transferase [Thermodesulfobacteriota bacterium]|nr:CoA-transferase [Thermodesulfobacteriota bacterium]